MTYLNYNQRIDFIHYFPNEIINTIFSFLSFLDRIHCLETSSTWRHYLLNWSLFWSDLDDPECDIGKDLLPLKQYIKSDSIQRVKICELNVDQQRRALDFLVQLKSCSIKSIIFSYRDDMKNNFDNLLACTGSSITYININVQSYALENFLEHLLIHCPNIESIKHTAGLSCSTFFPRATSLLGRRPFIRQPQQEQRQQRLPKSIIDKQPLKRIKLKSLYLKNVTSIQQILNGDIHIPNIEYISFFSSSTYQIKHIKQQGWPQLRYLYLDDIYLTEEGVISLTVAIDNMPLLASLVFNNNCCFSIQTNELFSAIGNLEHLEELCIMDKQNDTHILRNDDLSISPQIIQVNEEGYLALLNGKCRQTLRKLKLHPIAVLTNRILAAIPNQHYQQQQLTCLYMYQLYEEQPEDQVLTDEGLCSFASVMSCFKMDFLKLKLKKPFKYETIEYMNNTLGPNSIIEYINNSLGPNSIIEVSDIGKWTVYSLGLHPRVLASVSEDHVKHYAYENTK
ncbi:hypothetical protein BDC45DRAFT_565703 [Circinella umbellata]|nr:hypothetical protein BDC45DRAFT_565703 [Circinella umbellata]